MSRSERARAGDPPLHILWLKTELLHPVDKGGKIRTYQMLRELRRSHAITYVTLDDGGAAPDAEARALEYCDQVVRIPFRHAPKGSPRFFGELLSNLPSPLPFAVAKYRSPAMRRRLRALLSERPVDVLVCDFLFPSINVDVSGQVPTLLFQHNVEAAIWERHATVATNPVKRAYMREQWRRMRAFERAECRRFDRVVAVSAEDREAFRREYGVERVDDVPTGVDTEYFHPSGSIARDPRSLVFTGSMDWMPNEDAMLWFVRDVLPRVRAAMPDVTVTVVGRSPTPRVRALAGDGVVVTGSVPDVRPYLESGAAFIVPIRVGGGTRLKIFEAMAMEIPVVSTTIGAEGLPLRPGVDALIADDPESFAGALVRLLRDRDQAARLAHSAASLVREQFGWTRVAALFSEICEAARADWMTQRRQLPS